MLSADRMRQFVRDGYTTVEIELDEFLLAQAMALVWEFCPPSFRPDDPTSWTGMVTDSCITRSMAERQGRLKYRECARAFHSIRALTVNNEALRETVKSLISPRTPDGKPARFMPIFRGLYPIFSQPREVCRVRAHCDTHFFQVGTVMYLNETGPEDGAFVVWPGSHRLIAPHAYGLTHTHTPEGFDALCARIEREIEPVCVTGGPGTVILWHSRLLHSAGVNCTGGVRYGLLSDFKNGMADARCHLRNDRPFDETWSPEVMAIESGHDGLQPLEGMAG
ncbi:hypothetical protein E5163_03005 [Marinicauda algicola]|uniref:Phytanoyl-CoA dioxygenase family protein n=2 Tax=Marinicauda algicola TaxID=2029849 RepID=A0A4S2H3M6_9PROT|nr:phytanoyl-CoA dioxygenase family protein [Marinicauda algicola]TGY90113.1 hypothetical protein E5163_03005 [Marinicauda algicola]